MPRPKKRPQCTIRCKHCNAVKETDDEKYDVGQELIPYAGGGSYGYCWRCKKKGVIVIRVPNFEIKKAHGWNL
jgi:hypothetical protein